MAATDSKFSILLVCTANECRSVYAYDDVRSSAIGPQSAVWSAGTQATPGAKRCAYAVHSNGSEEHSATHIADLKFDKVDLILCMEREHQSRVAELDLRTRSRAFTVKTAAALATAVADSLHRRDNGTDGEFESTLPSDWSRRPVRSKMQWLVSEMNEARGFVTVPETDIPDAHGHDAAEHEFVLGEIHASVAELSQALAESVALAAIKTGTR